MGKTETIENHINHHQFQTIPPSFQASAGLPTIETEPLLLFESVSKWYGSVLALNQVTLELRGGMTGLVGSNGAGKSTLIKLATGLAKPTIGRVCVFGIDSWDWRARRLIGYCPDNDCFYEEMTGREFVYEMAKLNGYTAMQAKQKTDEALNRVDMYARADRKLRGYSKGMRQRIKLAQAILNQPKLLVLDEPLSGIDPVGREEMLAIFHSLANDGTCLLISSHELESLEKLTNHVIVMARGRVAAVGTLEQIRDRLNHVPLTISIEVEDARKTAKGLLAIEHVNSIEVENQNKLVVRTENPQEFFVRFGRYVASEKIEVRSMTPIDDSAHAILGYVLGGSGKT